MPSVSRSIAVNTVGNLTVPLLALATQPLLAYGLGLTGRGELAAATAPLMLVAVILTIGMPEAFTYYVARRTAGLPALLTRGFLLLGLAGILGTGAIAALAPLLTDDPALAALIMIAGLGLLPSLLVSGLRGLTAGHNDWNRIALERMVGAVGRFLAVLLLFALGDLTPLSATIAFAITNFIGGAVYLWPRRRSEQPEPATLPPGPIIAADLGPIDQVDEGGPLPDPRRTSVLSYGFRVWLGTLAGALMARLDQVLMTPLTVTEQLGLYAVAVSVAEVALVFNTSIREVMFSVEAESPSSRRIGLAARLSTTITLAIAVAVAVLAPWVFPWLFGPDFAAAVPVLWVLQIGVVLGNPGSTAGVALSARGRPELRSASLAIGVTANTLLVVLLVPPYGAMGAAVATLVGSVLAGNLNILFLRLRFGVPMSIFYALRLDDLRELRGIARGLLARGKEVA